MRIDGIQPSGDTGRPDLRIGNVAKPGTTSFKETFATFLKDVNESQMAAGEAQAGLLSGNVTDVHQVMEKSEVANTAFNMLMELRNKAVDGYQEIMRIRL